ncbi:unnamed protein product, partial [Cladocopium goreaui]
GLQPRHLQHMSMEAFYDLYKLWCNGNGSEEGEVAKNRCFAQVYEESRKCTLQHERDQLEQAQGLHIKNVRMYRQTQVVESYFVLEPDVPKDSSTEVSCILRALDQAREILESRGVAMPEHLIIEVKPSRNRELRAELLTGSLNWKEYYQQYDIYMSGLDLPLYDDKTGDSWAPMEIPGEDYPHDGADCILLLKHLVNSESLSQQPLTLLPSSFAAKLVKPLVSLPRNLLSDRAQKEWERFAPGPVQAVAVAPEKKPKLDEAGNPIKKRRGRQLKDPNAAPKKGGDVFADQSEVVSLAMPPQEPEPMAIDSEAAPSPPSRATFAGRTRLGSEEFQTQWDTRRDMYYKMVPTEFWKDPLERQFWSMCTSIGDIHEAMKKFLEKMGVSKQPAPSPKAAAKAHAKAKASQKKPAAAKVPGRGRARGRTGRGKKVACR